MKRRTFDFFWETAHKDNFQIPDRYPTLTFSSIAATGFGLSSYIVGIEDGYISRQEGAIRVLKTLNQLWNLPQGSDPTKVSGYKGFFYHFLTLDKVERFKTVELSSIDTGLLMAGVLSCMTYFDNPTSAIEKDIRKVADDLYRRVDWTFMMKKNGYMSMGWHPETGFIDSQWQGYNEAMVLLVMAIGSPSFPIQPTAWKKWCDTYIYDTYYGQEHVAFDPLFGHQYSHIWIDFRGIQDPYMLSKGSDYSINSRKATLANQQYCIDNPKNYKGYHKNCWGLTACDGPDYGSIVLDGKERKFLGYSARGASSIQVVDDGTIAPTAAGGSFPFTPVESEACLRYMWENYYSNLVGKYGFKDAFNVTYHTDKNSDGWWDVDYLGIDQGPILLQVANHEKETIWRIMRKNPYIVNGLKKAGFKGGWLER